ncbi:MAG: lamin tail domain-containing protein, partial [Planctomycetales bacterium]|nr:lamin tail domain-containing protein [Planctomycetales bacterium]
MLAAEPLISEFLASNDQTLLDGDGNSSDWIELTNTGDEAVDLAGWYLTDRADDLRRWPFPAHEASVLSPGEFLVVFASGQNDDGYIDALGYIHTNFSLRADGELLALVMPDGETIVSQFAPDGGDYPVQVTDVSYGLREQPLTETLIGIGAEASLLVPTDGALATTWTELDFTPGPQWATGPTGVGFDTSGVYASLLGTDLTADFQNGATSLYARMPFTIEDPAAVSELALRMRYDDGFVAYLNGLPVYLQNAPGETGAGVIANSETDFSGTQGANSWYYGYYNLTADADGTYAAADFVEFPSDGTTIASANNFWNGTYWDWYSGNPPWTYIGANATHPNGANNSAEHWTVRRWIAEATGQMALHVHLHKDNASGGGVTLRVFRNGEEVFARAIAGNDATGFTQTITLPAVNLGDAIDFAVTPVGLAGGDDDTSDTAIMTVEVEQLAGPPLAFDSTALSSHDEDLETPAASFDLTAFRDLLQSGENVLAIHALAEAPLDDDLLIAPELIATIRGKYNADEAVYFAMPTPGAPNFGGMAELGPIVRSVTDRPDPPTESDSLTIEAEVLPTLAPVDRVELRYRVMFAAETTLAMRDDGVGADRVAGDGVYTAEIPAGYM